jgi:flagellar motility protein MotE (MotC chaperone)
MRFRILPVVVFFLFSLVVAKVFDLALIKNNHDIQAVAENPKDAEPKEAAGEEAKTEEKKAEDGAEAEKNTAPVADGPVQKNPPKNIEISDQVPMERALLENLVKRRKELDEWANSISMKESILNATEKKISSKMEELKKLETDVTALLAQYKSKEDEKNKKLVKIYEGMKPAEAAKIFDTMDLAILLDIISGMNETSAAKIIAKMTTIKAKELTTSLAEQKRLAAK